MLRSSLSSQKNRGKGYQRFFSNSLIVGPFKLIAKDLANRLKSITGDIISKHKMVGMEGRIIHEDFLIASELVNAKIKEGPCGLVYKVESSEAFDHVW